jgi:4-pyridoxolactonase
MKVYLLDNGTLMLDKSLATWNHNQGIEFRFPVYCVFVDHPDGKIMLDTGFDKEWVERKLPFEKPTQTEEQTVAAQLAKLGVKPEEIDIVVNSHLHFDHCSANKLFPQATFVFSKSELRHAFVPDPWERLGYDPDLVWMPGMKMELLDIGDYEYEIVPGVSVILTPGHSNGHLSFIVRPGGGAQPMVFPVDVAYTRHNLEGKVLMGLHSDPEDLLRSMIKIENIAKKIGGTIFYSHDPESFAEYKLAPHFYGPDAAS